MLAQQSYEKKVNNWSYYAINLIMPQSLGTITQKSSSFFVNFTIYVLKMRFYDKNLFIFKDSLLKNLQSHSFELPLKELSFSYGIGLS